MHTRVPLRIALFGCSLALLGALPSLAEEPAADETENESEFFRTYRNYRTYAIEDTLPPEYRSREETQVTAPRVTLEEIIGRAVEAETNKYDRFNHIAYTITTKSVEHYGTENDSDYKRKIEETVSRMIHDSESTQSVSLGERRYSLDRDGNESPEEDPDESRVVSVESSEGLSDLPLFFADQSRYAFSIVERVLLDDRVLYDISFEPRSDFDALPTGHFWIDTADFQIIHVDITFLKNVPMPLILKGVDHFAIEKRRVSDVWVPSRISGRVRLRDVPLLPVPNLAEFSFHFDDYEFSLAKEVQP